MFSDTLKIPIGLLVIGVIGAPLLGQARTLPGARQTRVPAAIADQIYKNGEYEFKTAVDLARTLYVKTLLLDTSSSPTAEYYVLEVQDSRYCGVSGNCSTLIYSVHEGVVATELFPAGGGEPSRGEVGPGGLGGYLQAYRVLKTSHYGLHDVCYERKTGAGDRYVFKLQFNGTQYIAKELDQAFCD